MFELSDFTASTSVDAANATIAAFQAKLVVSVETHPEKGHKLHLVSLTRAYIQAIIRRSLELMEGAVCESRQKRGLTATICVRSLWETYAIFASFADQLTLKIRSEDAKSTAHWIGSQMLQTRIEKFIVSDNEAKNILTHIDKLAKRNAVFRTGYDYLSDFAHPNVTGTFAYYANVEGNSYRFNKDNLNKTKNLLAASAALLSMELNKINDLETVLLNYERS